MGMAELANKEMGYGMGDIPDDPKERREDVFDFLLFNGAMTVIGAVLTVAICGVVSLLVPQITFHLGKSLLLYGGIYLCKLLVAVLNSLG